MTGAELIKLIVENGLEDCDFYYATDTDCACCGGQKVQAVDIRIYTADIQKHISNKRIVVLK